MLVFYGDAVRDDPGGLDLSRCETVTVVVNEMVSVVFLEVRRSIRENFDSAMRGKKMVVEALICIGGNDGTSGR